MFLTKDEGIHPEIFSQAGAFILQLEDGRQSVVLLKSSTKSTIVPVKEHTHMKAILRYENFEPGGTFVLRIHNA